MEKDYAPYDSEFEAKWNTLDASLKNKIVLVALIAGLIVIGLVLYVFSRRQHDAFVEPNIKLQAR